MSSGYKICHLTTVHSPNDSRIYLKECSSLSAEGYEVSIIARNGRYEKRDRITVVPLPETKSRLLRFTIVNGICLFKALKENARVYHFHDPELMILGIMLKILGKKVIYDVHEDVPNDILTKEWIPHAIRNLVSKLCFHVENGLSLRMDLVITATPHIAKKFEIIGCNVVNVNNYPITDELFPANSDWTARERAVGYVGVIHAIRGIDEMLNAIEKVDAKLILAGKFSNEDHHGKAVGMPGWKKVEELGQIDRPRVAAMLSRCMAGMVLFHPVLNHIDSQPNKLFEYMSAGIPVIASNFPLWREIVEKNECGICVDPGDVESIAMAIRRIVDHPDEAKAMGENGRKAVVERYNWDREKITLMDAYRKLM